MIQHCEVKEKNEERNLAEKLKQSSGTQKEKPVVLKILDLLIKT